MHDFEPCPTCELTPQQEAFLSRLPSSFSIGTAMRRGTAHGFTQHEALMEVHLYAALRYVRACPGKYGWMEKVPAFMRDDLKPVDIEPYTVGQIYALANRIITGNLFQAGSKEGVAFAEGFNKQRERMYPADAFSEAAPSSDFIPDSHQLELEVG